MKEFLKNRTSRRIIWIVVILFFLMNIIAIFHAYKFTHFSDDKIERSKDPQKLGRIEKIKTLVFGVKNPRPTNKLIPTQEFETVRLKGQKEIECWYIPNPINRGTVIIYHGFSGNKASMLDKSDEFFSLGYNTLLVDFMGSGGSEGNQTTIGYFESEQVKTSYEYIKSRGESKIYLFGTSMGSVSIMKAFHDFKIDPNAIILECPFGSMYKTVCARFELMNAPAFPMAGLLVFWGGIQNGFWAFGHNPTKYAKSISCPTLIMYGEQDKKVSLGETSEIFSNLNGPKKMKIFPEAGHENLLNKNSDSWKKEVSGFLKMN